MTILSRNDQKGRSMVEMLGVLAIIGVLSVGGISGYSKAMAKFKLTKAQDQITMLLMNIRTAYATSPSYSGLSTSVSREFNIAPSDMFSTVSGALNNAFGGRAYVYACSSVDTGGVACSGTGSGSPQYFAISLSHLGREACVSLASADWGTDGLIGVQVSGGTSGQTRLATQLPFSIADAGSACPSSGSYGSITWTYY